MLFIRERSVYNQVLDPKPQKILRLDVCAAEMQRAFSCQSTNFTNQAEFTQHVVNLNGVNVSIAEVGPKPLQKSLHLNLQPMEVHSPGFAQRQPTRSLH